MDQDNETPHPMMVVIIILVFGVAAASAWGVLDITEKRYQERHAVIDCRWPEANEKLVITLNHADGKNLNPCTYYPLLGYGMAKK